MAETSELTETILIVDDEEPVRRTFREWLTGMELSCNILTAHDAESALQLANQQTIDLAILDWALGAGDDGLQLLQDLYAFHPDVVAIMVTGFANQATPLDAMRMGVRDYLDKNQDLSRETFLQTVRKQLDFIRPAKRARRLHQTLVAFRESVEKILPLVQSAAALHDPVPLPEAISSLVRFLVQTIRARDGVLFVRHYEAGPQPIETCRVYDASGQRLGVELVPFARSVAGAAVSLQEPCMMHDLEKQAAAGAIELQPFEKNRRSLLAVAMDVAPGIQAVIELFDKGEGSFSADDQRLVKAAADLGSELLRQALAHRQTSQLLLDAVGAALRAGEKMAETLGGTSAQRLEQPPPAQVMDQLKESLGAAGQDKASAEASLRLAEAIRVLSLRHGPAALEHCLRLVENVRSLLDKVVGE